MVFQDFASGTANKFYENHWIQVSSAKALISKKMMIPFEVSGLRSAVSTIDVCSQGRSKCLQCFEFELIAESAVVI